MKEFALIFRLKNIEDFKPSPQQMKARMEWLADIAAKNLLVDKGSTLLPGPGSAKVLKNDGSITDGPHAEMGGLITGYVVVKAEQIEDALTMARKNPIFEVDGNIEVREVLKRE